MSWKVLIRPQVEQDIADAAQWYNSKEEGLGSEFVESIIRVWDALEHNPLIGSIRHSKKDIHWRYADRFPYRVIYDIDDSEKIIVVVAVLHAALHDQHWIDRV